MTGFEGETMGFLWVVGCLLRVFLWAFCRDMTENDLFGPIRVPHYPAKNTPSPALFGTQMLHTWGVTPGWNVTSDIILSSSYIAQYPGLIMALHIIRKNEKVET
jgi:hypothetical protein